MGGSNQPAFGVINIRAEHDVGTELRLSPPQLQMLTKLAAAGGEMPFSWDVFATKHANAKTELERQTIIDARESVIDLVNARYVREVEYHAGVTVRLVLRLTDKGRSVVAEHEKFRLVPESMKPVSAEEIVQEIQKS
jgi:hypothetical protein